MIKGGATIMVMKKYNLFTLRIFASDMIWKVICFHIYIDKNFCSLKNYDMIFHSELKSLRKVSYERHHLPKVPIKCSEICHSGFRNSSAIWKQMILVMTHIWTF
jgi:hypothetical protein